MRGEMTSLLAPTFCAGFLLSICSFSSACLPNPAAPTFLLSTALSISERLYYLPSSSRNEASEDALPNSSFMAFTFPSKCPLACVQDFLKYHNHSGSYIRNNSASMDWKYQTNLTNANRLKLMAARRKKSKWLAKMRRYGNKLSTDGLSASELRQIRVFLTGSMSLKKNETRKYSESTNDMATTYSSAKVVRKNGQRLPGQSEVEKFFRLNRNYDDLAEVWTLWRNAAGRPQRAAFERLVSIKNQLARRKNFTDFGRYTWMTDYENPRFNERVMEMLDEVMPLYKELHAYVRFKLAAKYPKRFDPSGPIPAHILGNPWAQSWQNIFDIVQPYPNAQSTDVTAEMQRQNWTVLRMFKTAEEFFTSLGLPKMKPKFWKLSMMKKPKGRRVVCHGSAWDFSTQDDFRIKMCTEITQNDLLTIHHEMGHTTYQMLYAHQPLVFRGGANPAFHEAVGDTVGLSVNSVKHLNKLGLIKFDSLSRDVEINTLMRMALEKVALLPYSLTMDAWRWRVYNGSINASAYTQGWWQLRRDFQGVVPPVARTEEDFDPGAKYHIANDIPYIRYFVSFFMQFQFYDAFCKVSGHKGPLYTCDFYNSKATGDLLKSALSLGHSKPWPEIMKNLTGLSDVTTDALRRYFSPLFAWLKNYRKIHGYPIGW